MKIPRANWIEYNGLVSRFTAYYPFLILIIDPLIIHSILSSNHLESIANWWWIRSFSRYHSVIAPSSDQLEIGVWYKFEQNLPIYSKFISFIRDYHPYCITSWRSNEEQSMDLVLFITPLETFYKQRRSL